MKTKRTVASIVAVLLLAATVLALPACSGGAYNLPIVCGETGMTDACGVATYGVDYYSLGVKAGDMAADILLTDADPATMAVATDPNPALSINEDVAAAIGFEIPKAIKDKATGGETQKVTRETSAIVADGADFTVGILQLTPHVALDLSNEGFQDQLSVRMKAAGKTVNILNQNAAGETANNVTIAEAYVSQNVDLIYTIATSSSQAAAEATAEKGIPVVFNAVTDPVNAGLVESMTAPGGNVTGVSDINPVGAQIDLIAELLGKDDVKIGFLYTSAETNSVFQLNLAKDHVKGKDIVLVEKGIGDLNDIQNAFIALKNEGVDAIYIPTDNLLASGIETVHTINIGE